MLGACREWYVGIGKVDKDDDTCMNNVRYPSRFENEGNSRKDGQKKTTMSVYC